MSIATITCPRCSSNLRTTKPFGDGSRFRCPGCGFAFAAGTQVTRPSATAGVRPLPPDVDAPAPPRSGGWLVLAAVAGLAVLLLAGAGVALAVHFLPKRESQPVAAVAPPPATSPAPAADAPPVPPAAPPATPAPPAQSVLPAEEQEKVNKAIGHGVDWLKENQRDDGSWAKTHAVGLAALPGLTLLECGVPTDDSHVRKAAQYVRDEAPTLDATYELGLAILFLDRLGDPKDEPIIRTMALRLLAGQTAAGGWGYTCPILTDKKEEQRLWTVLETTRPRSSLDLTATKSGDKGIDDLLNRRLADKPDQPGGTVAPPPGPTEDEVKEAKKLYDKLPPNLKAIPALKPPTQDEHMPGADKSDNSNTQFATLGLWAAGRHGVPMDAPWTCSPGAFRSARRRTAAGRTTTSCTRAAARRRR